LSLISMQLQQTSMIITI